MAENSLAMSFDAGFIDLLGDGGQFVKDLFRRCRGCAHDRTHLGIRKADGTSRRLERQPHRELEDC